MKILMAALAVLVTGADGQTLVVAGDLTVDATVQQTAARIRLDPGGPSMPVFNPDFATRAGFRAGWIGTRAGVGPVYVHGRSAVIRIDLGRGAFKRRATWFTAPLTSNADGVIGPGGLPMAQIRFDLRAPAPNERSVTLPLADFGPSGMGVRMDAGDEKVDVSFTQERRQSLATAVAGAAIAATHGGAFDAAPETMPIKLGVSRPVRHLALRTPFAVGPLALSGMLVRTADFGSAGSIPDADAPPPDPDEVVITGERKGKGKPRRVKLEVGSDDLARCSSILFDKQARTVTLSCR